MQWLTGEGWLPRFGIAEGEGFGSHFGTQVPTLLGKWREEGLVVGQGLDKLPKVGFLA